MREAVAGFLHQDAEDQAQQRAQQRAHSVERHFPPGSVFEAEVDLGLTGSRGGSQAVGAVLHVEHPCAGNNNHAVACKPVPPAEVDVIAAPGQCGVEAAKLLPDVASDQHACRIDCEGVRAGIVLALIHLVSVDQRQAFCPSARGQAHINQVPLVVPAQLLAAGNCYRRSPLNGVEEFRQRIRGRGRVIMKQPDPFRCFRRR